MRVAATLWTALLLATPLAAGPQQTSPSIDPGVYAETESGTVALKQSIAGIEIAGSMRSSIQTRAFVFPISTSTLDGVPVAADVAAFLVNLATIDDRGAAAAQMRFTLAEPAREPDYETMAVRPAKFRTGLYRISSPNLAREWMATAYAKLTNKRQWRDKHPRAIVGLIVNGQTMFPVRIDPASLMLQR